MRKSTVSCKNNGNLNESFQIGMRLFGKNNDAYGVDPQKRLHFKISSDIIAYSRKEILFLR